VFSLLERKERCEIVPEKGIVGKGKGRCTLIQGVTVPLNCRVFINPQFLQFDFFLNPSVSLAVVC
jgi:hypothetical protein